MNPFDYLVLGVIGFIVVRVLYWALVQIPQGHAKDEAICEKCLGKVIEDDVTEPLEWCDCDHELGWCSCPNREDEVDQHE